MQKEVVFIDKLVLVRKRFIFIVWFITLLWFIFALPKKKINGYFLYMKQHVFYLFFLSFPTTFYYYNLSSLYEI
jgi:hypothetical protein